MFLDKSFFVSIPELIVSVYYIFFSVIIQNQLYEKLITEIKMRLTGKKFEHYCALNATL